MTSTTKGTTYDTTKHKEMEVAAWLGLVCDGKHITLPIASPHWRVQYSTGQEMRPLEAIHFTGERQTSPG